MQKSFKGKLVKGIVGGMLAISGVAIGYHQWQSSLDQDAGKLSFESREAYEAWLEQHPFNNRTVSPGDIKKMPKKDRPDLAMEHQFLMTMDPALGYPPTERLNAAHRYNDLLRKQNAAAGVLPGVVNNEWTSRGPYNVGGRTRAILWDSQKENKVWAGCVGGGLWSIEDVTDPTAEWQPVNDFWSNLAVSCIAQDPNDDNTMYVGTGEGFGLGSSSYVRGNGLFKSSDGGATWNQLESTMNNSFTNCQDVKVHPTLGLFVATRSAGIQRSVDGGATWTTILGAGQNGWSGTSAGDIEFAADGTIFFGMGVSSAGALYRTADCVTFTRLTNNGSGIPAAGHRRMELATAPSNANVVYVVSCSSSNTVYGIWKSEDKGDTWTQMTEPNDSFDNGIPATDFSRGQAWYDLILKVNPSDENEIYVGGIDLFKSFDGGSNWEILSNWSESNAFVRAGVVPYVHADQHAMEFKPGDPNVLLFGNDGGVWYTDNAKDEDLNIVMRNQNYNVTQFYAGDIHPGEGENKFLAGAQDNGTQYFDDGTTIDSTDEALGGDGMFCFMDQENGNNAIASVYNNVYALFNDGFADFNIDAILVQDQSTGRFVNPADFDSEEKILYSGRTSSTIYRITNATTAPNAQSVSVTGMGGTATHLRTSPYSDALFIGSPGGRVILFENASTANSGGRQIHKGGMPAGNVSCIEIGASEDELLVTYSNYGINSVYYTEDGGDTWTSKEGNLPDMPIRWALFNPLNRKEVLLATESGVWGTDDIHADEVMWYPSNGGLANVSVHMLNYRSSDHTVVAATHGRGLFSSQFKSCELLEVAAVAGDEAVCGGSEHSYQIQAIDSALNYVWTVPVDATILSGEGTTSITVKFGNESGVVSAAAESSCGVGPATETMVEVIPIPSRPEGIVGERATCVATTDLTYTIAPISGAESYRWSVPDGSTIISGQGTNEITINVGFASGEISVYAENECGEGPETAIELEVGSPGSGPAITESQTVIIPNEENVTFSCEENEEILIYGWTVPEDAVIVSGQGTSTIVVNFGVQSGDVCVAGTYTCGLSEQVCTPAVVGGDNCGLLVLEYPYIETFDQMNECFAECGTSCSLESGWRNVSHDDMDWSTKSGATPSSFTGPTGDVNGGGNYLYTEATGFCSPYANAILETPCFSLSSLSCPKVEFSYHMRGSQMGTLKLEVEDATQPNQWHVIKTLTGHQGSTWNKAVVDLGRYTSTLVRFRLSATTGAGFRSDMAIDDFRVYDCNLEVPVFANCPMDVVACNGVAHWDAPNVYGGVGNVEVTASHQPGTVFETGTHEVTYTATDEADNVSTCTFMVTTVDGPAITNVDVSGVSRFWRTDGTIDVTTTGGTGALSYLWSNGAMTEDVAGVGIGAYTLNISDEHNCKTDVRVFVGLGWARGGGVFGKENADVLAPEVEFSVFPNPTSDFVNVRLSGVESSEIVVSLMDMKGGAIAVQRAFQVGENGYAEGQLDISNMSAGEYLIVINAGDKMYKQQVMLTK